MSVYLKYLYFPGCQNMFIWKISNGGVNKQACGDLPSPPRCGQTSWVYSSNPVQFLYISCYVTVNKLVLSYLLLHLLPQWWPQPGCTLCTVHCTSVHSHIGIFKRRSLSLSPSSVTFFFPILQCALHWQQLSKCFSLLFSLRNLLTFVLFFLLEVGHSYYSTQFWTHLFCYSYFCLFSLRSFRAWADILVSGFLALFVIFILCVSHSNLQYNFLFQSYLAFVSSCIVLPYSDYHILFFLGRVPNKLLDFACLFRAFKHDLWRSDPPCRCSSNCSG